MFFLVGVAASALSTYAVPQQTDATTSSSASASSSTAQQPSPFDGLMPGATGGTQPSASAVGFMPISPDMMSAMIAAQSQQTGGQTGAGAASQSASSLFAQIDTNGDGSISKSEMENVFGAGNSQVADKVFSKLDANGDGSISEDELQSAQQQAQKRHRHHHHMGGLMEAAGSAGAGGASATGGAGSSDGAGGDPNSLTGADATGATTKTVSNGDGSTTTTITYADGSKVSSTSAPTGSSGSQPSANGSHKGNFLEQLIQIQAQSINAATAASPTA